MTTKTHTAAERAAEAIYKLSWSDSSMPVMTDEGKREVGRMSAIIAREYAELENKVQRTTHEIEAFIHAADTPHTEGEWEAAKAKLLSHAKSLRAELKRVRGQQ